MPSASDCSATLVGYCNGDGRRGASGWTIWIVQLDSHGVYDLMTVPDVFDLHTRQPKAAVALPGVSWCTVWKGTPQDCMDHLRRAHAVPAEVRTSNMGQWFPPWTVRREVWSDALKPCYLGISTDVLLCSELGHVLVPEGATHISLRRDYLTWLRVFVSQATATAMGQCGQPDDTGLHLLLRRVRALRKHDSDEESPRKTRRMTRRGRSTHVQDISAGVLSPVAISDWDPDTIVYDCRPPVLPVSIRMKGPRALVLLCQLLRRV